MNVLLGILLIVVLIVLWLSIIIHFRNSEVYVYRMKRLDALKLAYDEGKLSAEEFHRELRYFKAVSYNSMVYMFWRPLDSF